MEEKHQKINVNNVNIFLRGNTCQIENMDNFVVLFHGVDENLLFWLEGLW